MRAGSLRNRVSIEEAVTVSDGQGGRAITEWTPIATVWASVRPFTGRETFETGQILGAVSHEVKIRYRAGIGVKHRITYKDRTLYIKGVSNSGETGNELVLSCEEEPQAVTA